MNINYKKTAVMAATLGIAATLTASIGTIGADRQMPAEGGFNRKAFETPEAYRIMSPKTESTDSANLTINVTYGNKSETVANAMLFPMDTQKLGNIITGKLNQYVYRVEKGEYEFLLMGAKASNAGEMFYYAGNLKVNGDTAISINTADITIETPFKNILPNGEEVKQDLYITSTKTVLEKGNVHTGSQCIFTLEHALRKQHLAHLNINLNYQKSKPETATPTDTRKKPTIWVNTKDMPFNFFEVYDYITPQGIVAMRYAIPATQLGDTITTDASDWNKMDVNYAEVPSGSPTAGFFPECYNGNGLNVWYNGELVTLSMGFAAADSTDVKKTYWINSKKGVSEKEYNFSIFPAKALNKVGISVNGILPLPLTVGTEGIMYAPIQYVFSGLKIYAGSNGSTYYINKAFNTRYTADENTLWGEGFPYTGFYPRTPNNLVNSPNIELGIKGVNGEQRSVDMQMSELTIDTLANGEWKTAYTDKPDNVTRLGSILNTARYMGKVGLQVCDSNYSIAGTAGCSVSRLEFDNKKMDAQQTGLVLPVVNMVNVRNKEGRIATSVDYLNNASIEVYAAEMKFNMVSMMGYKVSPISEITAKFKPHESEEWTEIPMKANPEYDNPIFWGNHYSGSMNSLLKDYKTGTYDLELTASDTLGNKYILTASPAFYIENDDNNVGVEEVASPVSEAILITGTEIVWPGHPEAKIEIYGATGALICSVTGRADKEKAGKGPVIIRASDKESVSVRKAIF